MLHFDLIFCPWRWCPLNGDGVHTQAVPHDLTLAGVRDFIWRKKKELCLHYRVLDEAQPAPVPVLEPL